MSTQRGFSLIELALALVVLGLLASGLLSGLAAQQAAAERQEALRQLGAAHDAVLGFALVHGRLPCPADPALASQLSPAGSEDCSRQHGVLPWVTLGVPETDPWNHRLSYYAGKTFTTAGPGAAPAFTLDSTGSADVQDGHGKTVAGSLPAVIVSHGSRGGGAWNISGVQLGGAGGDELENADADLLFIQRPTGQDFDDLLIWIVPAVLKARLVAAGRLP